MGRMKSSESGNVLFIILIAAALFGALSFAVSDMLRGGEGQAISREKTELYASEILDRARQYRQAVQEARAGFGCGAEEISFAHPVLTGYEHSPVADDECQVFGGASGGASYTAPPEDWLDLSHAAETGYGQWFFTGEACVYDVGNGGSDCATANGSGDTELIAVMPWVKREICVAINDALSVGVSGAAPPRASGTSWNGAFNPFTGGYSQGGAVQSDTSDSDTLTGVVAGCFEGGGSPPAGSYHYYQVLIAR